jgi:hypothetical protein
MITTLALSVTLVLSGSPAQAATKPVSFRGFTIQIPGAWKVKSYVHSGSLEDAEAREPSHQGHLGLADRCWPSRPRSAATAAPIPS